MWREKFNKGVDTLVRWIQRVLITVLLTLTYIFGLALTWLPARMSRWAGRKSAHNGSYWKDAEGYETSLEDAGRQS
jgi:hypothetical protein